MFARKLSNAWIRFMKKMLFDIFLKTEEEMVI